MMSTHPGSESERPAAGLLEQREAGGQRCSLPSLFIQPQRQAFPQVHNYGPLPTTSSLRCNSQQQTARLLFFLPFLPLFSLSALFSAPELLLCLSGRMCVPQQKGNFTKVLYCQERYVVWRKAGSGSQDARSGPYSSASSLISLQLSPFLFNVQPARSSSKLSNGCPKTSSLKSLGYNKANSRPAFGGRPEDFNAELNRVKVSEASHKSSRLQCDK
ncbi:uncharacterized [Tachysurus ichikawai]